ncbi:MAG: hypothetical protein NW207_12180 [Cytophagales bacterium]|nr:hypothetical protein [Cytophagales bacterium]
MSKKRTYEYVTKLLAQLTVPIINLGKLNEEEKILRNKWAEKDRIYKEKEQKYKEESELRWERINKRFEEFSKKISDFTDTLGLYVEHQVRPAAMDKFSKYNINIHEACMGLVQRDKNDNFDYQIDLLVANSECAVVVESKSKLKIKDVDEHMARMVKIKDNPHKVLKNSKILGAVAGMAVHDNAKDYDIKKGFFVFVPAGESVKIANSKDFGYKIWETLN